MAAAGRMTFKERDLLKHATMRILIKRGTVHPLLMRFGVWLMMLGARIVGVGNIHIEDGYSEDLASSNPAYQRRG